jgi:hypothetical protein
MIVASTCSSPHQRVSDHLMENGLISQQELFVGVCHSGNLSQTSALPVEIVCNPSNDKAHLWSY